MYQLGKEFFFNLRNFVLVITMLFNRNKRDNLFLGETNVADNKSLRNTKKKNKKKKHSVRSFSESNAREKTLTFIQKSLN